MSDPGDAPPWELLLISESAEDRHARIERIGRSITDGAYEVSPRQVADAVVAFFRRDWVAGESGNADFGDKSC